MHSRECWQKYRKPHYPPQHKSVKVNMSREEMPKMCSGAMYSGNICAFMLFLPLIFTKLFL